MEMRHIQAALGAVTGIAQSLKKMATSLQTLNGHAGAHNERMSRIEAKLDVIVTAYEQSMQVVTEEWTKSAGPDLSQPNLHLSAKYRREPQQVHRSGCVLAPEHTTPCKVQGLSEDDFVAKHQPTITDTPPL